MTELILVRHGFSKANKLGVYAGNRDYPLSELGLEQARLCGEWFKDSEISAIYSSDLQRAYMTACFISEATGIDVFAEKELRECDGGDWEGVKYSDIEKLYPDDYNIWNNDIGKSKCTNGESIKQCANRILSAVRRIAEINDGRKVCIVTHATPIRIMTAAAKNVALEELAGIPWSANASINTFEYIKGVFSVIKLNDDEYLGNMHSSFHVNMRGGEQA